MHKNVIFYALICINNHIIITINFMLSIIFIVVNFLCECHVISMLHIQSLHAILLYFKEIYFHKVT